MLNSIAKHAAIVSFLAIALVLRVDPISAEPVHESSPQTTLSRVAAYHSVQQRLESYFDSGQEQDLNVALETARALAEQSADSFCLHQCMRYQGWSAAVREHRRTLKGKFQENLDWRSAKLPPDSAAHEFAARARDFLEIGDSAAAIKAWQYAGDLFSSLGKTESATIVLSSALALSRVLGDLEGMGRTYNVIGSHQERIGEYLAAGDYFDSSRVIRAMIGDKRGVAECLSNISSIYMIFERRDEALRFAGESLRIRNQIGDTNGVLQIVLNLIPSVYNVVSLDSLQGLFRIATSHMPGIRDDRLEIRMELCRALVLNREGRTVESLVILTRLTSDFKPTVERRLEQLVLQHLASLQMEVGDFRAAIRVFQRALSLAEASGNRIAQATIIHNIGVVQQRCGNLEAASALYQRSLSLREQAQVSTPALATLANLADIMITARDFETAEQYLTAAVALANQSSDLPAKERIAFLQARFAATRGDYSQAGHWIDSAEMLGTLPSPKREFDLVCLRADLARKSRNLRAADSLAQAAQAIAEDKPSNESLMKLELLRAEIALDRRDWSEARANLTRLVARLERSRAALPDLQMRSDFQSQSRAAYELLISAYFEGFRSTQREAMLDSILVYIEKAKSRSLLDALSSPNSEQAIPDQREQHLLARLDSLETQISSAPLRAGNAEIDQINVLEAALADVRFKRIGIVNPAVYRANRLSIAILRQRLDSETMLVSYLLAPERSYAVIVTRDTAVVETLPGRTQITKLIGTFSRLVQLSIIDESLLDSLQLTAAELGRILLPDAGSFGESVRNLLVCPDAALSVLPFEALLLRNKYLVERFAIATIPSVYLLTGRSNVEDRKAKRLLAIADPRPATQMRQLPYSDDEVASAAQAFAAEASTVLAGPAATRTSLLKLDLSSYTHLHLATHSTIDYDDPWRSKIWLSRDSLDQGANDFLSLADIRRLRLPAALVVLSSCESGGGSFELSEGLNGFVRAFLEAGAQNLVVSLWEVEDFATAGFMASFYRHLHLGYATALQQAKKEMIASPRRKHRHPYYWSPFLLTTVNPMQR